ncbi:hypothetical protein OC835_002302 [Tilletia horrida]|nr:hypothetical protein OC835_002302 [Tilletia horrida]
MLFGSSSSKRAPALSPDVAPQGSRVWFQPDDTFRSFCALLEAPAVSHAHIALIGPDALTASIANYTGALTHEHIAEFVKLIATSPCLWASVHPDASAAQQAQKAVVDSGAPALPSLQDRTNHLVQAVGQAVGQRISLSMRARYNSTGWQTRRIFAHWVSTVIANSANDVSELADSQDLAAPYELQSLKGLPVARLAICTGLVAGLQGAKVQWEQQGRIGLDVRYAIKLAEDGWAAAFGACLELIDKMPLEEQQSAAVIPLHCAVQVMPFINPRRLEALSGEVLLRLVTDRLLCPIERAQLLESLEKDVRKDSNGKLVLEPTSATAQRVKALQNNVAFQTIAPLSRILSGTLARLTRKLSPEDLAARLFGILIETKDGGPGAITSELRPTGVQAVLGDPAPSATLLRRLQASARVLEKSWWSTDLATCAEADLAEASRPVTKELWTVFKTLLFSYTMIFDSLVDAVVDVCPSPTMTLPPVTAPSASSEVQPAQPQWGPTTTSNIPTPYLQCMHSVLTTYAHMYWITSTFGHDGFDVYRSVFYSALDVLGRDGEACVGLLEGLVPHLSYGPDRLQETSATYLLLVAEQLIAVLPDAMVERLILPICRPYLTDTSDKDAFESAHSVLLAIFAHDKGVVESLAPYYVELLISGFPSRLNAGQFEHAFTTVMSSISDRDDALAWWAMDLLAEEIAKERASPSASCADPNAGSKQGGQAGTVPGVSRELELQLVYVAQVSTVNLVLLRSVLSKVRRYILQHIAGHISIPGLLPSSSSSSSGDAATTERSSGTAEAAAAAATGFAGAAARQRLCEKTFDALSGLDASTREEGLRWWLDNRGAFGV